MRPTTKTRPSRYKTLSPAAVRICTRCSDTLSGDSWHCKACDYQPPLVDEFLTFAPDITLDNECYAQDIIDELATLEAHNFWFINRNKLILQTLRKYFPAIRNFFEVGCGNGYVLTGIADELPQIELYGCDGLTSCLSYAKKRLPQAHLFQMDARQIPFANSFDIAGAFDVLEHIEDDDIVLDQLHQSIRPGGGLLITVPQYKILWSKCDDYVKHVRRYERKELEDKVKQAGFRILKVTSFVTLLLPMLVGSRIWQHISPRPHHLINELRLQGVLGELFEKILGIERAWINAGASLPLGGSLFLIAQRLPEESPTISVSII